MPLPTHIPIRSQGYDILDGMRHRRLGLIDEDPALSDRFLQGVSRGEGYANQQQQAVARVMLAHTAPERCPTPLVRLIALKAAVSAVAGVGSGPNSVAMALAEAALIVLGHCDQSVTSPLEVVSPPYVESKLADILADAFRAAPDPAGKLEAEDYFRHATLHTGYPTPVCQFP